MTTDAAAGTRPSEAAKTLVTRATQEHAFFFVIVIKKNNRLDGEEQTTGDVVMPVDSQNRFIVAPMLATR